VCIRQDQVSLDELPTLEAELLLLKENIQNHINLLTSEIAVLNDWQVKRKRKHSDTGESLSSVTRSKPVPPSNDGNVPNSKKFKSNQSSGDDQPGGGRKKKSGKSKGSSDFVADKGPIESALIKSKTEGADKFWSLLEPYFADITEADLTSLSENVSYNYYDDTL
jgi:transcriptional adapter 3